MVLEEEQNKEMPGRDTGRHGMPVREAGLECEARFTNGGPTARFVLIGLYASPEPHPKGAGYRCIRKIISYLK